MFGGFCRGPAGRYDIIILLRRGALALRPGLILLSGGLMGAGASCGLQNRFGGLGATWVSSILTSSRQRVYRASFDGARFFVLIYQGDGAGSSV